ncbi:MAG: hypothetical protein J3K34DRAFT_395497 [Monoraphidium minutum]|nr:MAG: hypothetical protein J3K34DRAFT_395497 [Monoraphidium minutum]
MWVASASTALWGGDDRSRSCPKGRRRPVSSLLAQTADNGSPPLPEDVALATLVLRSRTRRRTVGAQAEAGPAGEEGPGADAAAASADESGPADNFIPLRYPDLRDRLVDGHPEIFASSAVRAKFYQLAEAMSLRNTLTMTRAFRPLSERYAYLDPEVDTDTGLAPDLTGSDLSRRARRRGAQQQPREALPGQGPGGISELARLAGGAWAISGYSSGAGDARAVLVEEFEEGMRQLLIKGGFEELSEQQLQQTLNTVGVRQGLRVRPPDPAAVQYRIFVRGTRTQEVRYCSWRTLGLYRSARVPVYQRVALVFRVRSEMDARAFASADAGAGWLWRLYMSAARPRFIKVAEAAVSPIKVTLINVLMRSATPHEVSNTDMLLPGSVARFSWLDWALIVGPVAFGLISAIAKAARGSLNFDSLPNILSSVLLVILPVTWALRACLAVAERQRQYAAHLNRVFLLHNLNNNGGVISQTLEEAREQDDDEAILAFFFLWRGQARPSPMVRRDLDAAVEGWVNALLRGEGGGGEPGGGRGERSAVRATHKGAAADGPSKGGKPQGAREPTVHIDFHVSAIRGR